LLSKFIIHNDYDRVDIAMEMAPSMIESRLREILNYLKSNPNDSEAVDYAKELIRELKEFNRELAAKYSRELSTILNPKPAEPEPAINVEDILKPANEPKAKVRVIKPEPVVDGNNVLKPVTERRLRQIRGYERLRPKLRGLREETARALENARKREIRDIEDTLRQIFELLKDPRESKNWGEYVEAARGLIERLRELDAKKASEYEEKLKAMINLDGVSVLRSYLSALEKRKYANYGRKEPRAKVRIKRASAKITDYFNESENADNDNKPWKRHVKGILKWVMVIGLI
jgi:hypothetical protein